MDLTFEPGNLSIPSRITLGVLLAVNLLLLACLLLAEPRREESVGSGSTFAQDKRLILIGELSEDDRASRILADVSAVRTLTENAAEVVQVELSCQAWGPFADENTLESVRAAVAEVDPQVRAVVIDVEAPPDFLVYLDSDNNLDNARRILQELESQNIEAYVIAGGEFLNSVSAGVFSNRSGAEEVRQRLADLGYTAAVQALERSQQMTYLVGRVPASFLVGEMQSEPCATIAPLQEIL